MQPKEDAMSLFERILVPLDGSPLAEKALGQVRRILRRADAEAVLIRAVEPPAVAGDFYTLAESLEEEADRYLAGVERSLSDEGARVRRVVRRGPAAETLLSAADDERASLIVMTTHGRSGIARWILGSVTEKVLRASPVPVWVTRSFDDQGAPAEDSGPVRTVLVPIHEEASLAILPAIVDVARLHEGLEVRLVHVLPEGGSYSVPVPSLARAYHELRGHGIAVEPLLRKGDAASEILETAHSERADLIAMTTHGRSGPSRWALGSVTEKVLRGASIPLLVGNARCAWIGSARPAGAVGTRKG